MSLETKPNQVPQLHLGDQLVSTGTHEADDLLVPQSSNRHVTLSIIVPSLNEEQGIQQVLRQAKNAIVELNIPSEIIVADSSTDQTPTLAREMGAFVVKPPEMGYGSAYRYGFRHARGDYVAIGDADCTYNFEEIPRLFRLVQNGEADMAIGSRLNGNIENGAMPLLHRYIGNPLLTRFLNAFYDAGVSDAHSGFRVLSREALNEMNLESSGMEFASEMIMQAGSLGLSIAEVPITYHERRGDATINSFRDGWRHIKFMLLNAPGHLFLIPGAVFMFIGALIMPFAYYNVNFGSISFGIHSMIAGSLLSIVGFQIASLGIFAIITGEPINKPSDPMTNLVIEWMSLEKGATIGALIFGIGSLYAIFLISRWLGSGFSTLPMLMSDIAAFTAIILGVQMVFASFFFGHVE